ncbi:LysR family transcriptional regulator [Niveibacterium sp. 24ML]|uniref:LysR family transcriptional regulator n=1 Tax=Niveibacterium sp. 24ML TaxID=2985512 RepID=UPI00226E0CA6|nr:LysR family transcriptional regulator [Niveibacterium sp. 24ML]MCX9154950.1 LysR family transcriptional regulator [Niveibacterium sp. 24ML]
MRRRIPSTAALLAFEAAARHLSFTKAGEELALTQSAICRQIASLEAFLGVALFRRARRGVLLTEAGERYGRQISGRLDAVERDTLELMAGRGLGGTLELGVVPSFATRWLVPRLVRFHAAHPDITVNLSVRTRPFLFEDSGLDAAITAALAPWPGTEADRLMAETSIAVASPALLGGAAPCSPAAIAALPLLQQSTRPYAWRHWFAACGVSVAGDLAGPRYELFSMLAEAAICGGGVALIPPLLIEDELTSGRLVRAAEPQLDDGRAYWLVWPEGSGEGAVMRVFRNWLAGELAPSPSTAP